ncbi:DMT family transporter [Bifidobacterium jacchi]|uniref:DMT family transporter n=1 Tax=Bifidobacterium jacchi TaxID=2490545 RepID=A0A5N5RKC6_9BIFI|nr:DMT family transporter [Bifidobacterium jacchi]KAB5607772.1 DMT family transporter [Bifidobacterium jacchi]
MACLTLTAMIWGFAFVSQVQGMASMTPLFFNAVRFTLGAFSLVPLLLVDRVRTRRAAARGSRRMNDDRSYEPSSGQSCSPVTAPLAARSSLSRTRRILPSRIAGQWSTAIGGIACALALFSASTLQQYGIMNDASAGRAGFITALYIVLVPILSWMVLRRTIGITTIVSVAIAIVGFYLLCVTNGFGSITIGDVLLLCSSVLFAVHILVVDACSKRMNPLRLSFMQFAGTAAFSWIATLLEGSVNWSGMLLAWPAVVYAGIGSVGIAYTLQIIGQQWVPPTRASLILSLESLFSAIGGAVLLSERMTGRAYLGCALIFIGTLLAQMPVSRPSASLRRVVRR